MFLRMQNLAGRSFKTGLTLHATGLYFFLADINVGIGERSVSVAVILDVERE